MNKMERLPTPDVPFHSPELPSAPDPEIAAPKKRRGAGGRILGGAVALLLFGALALRILAALQPACSGHGDGGGPQRVHSKRADGDGPRERRHDGGELAGHDRSLRAGQYLRARERLHLPARRRYRQPCQGRAAAGRNNGPRTRSSDRAGGGYTCSDAGLAAAGEGQSRSRPRSRGIATTLSSKKGG